MSHQSVVSGHVIPCQPISHWDGSDIHPGAYSGQDAYTGRLIPCPDNDSVGALCARDFKGVGNQFVQEGKCIPCKPITQSDVAGPLDAHYYKGPGSRQGGEREYVAQPIPFRKSKRAASTTDNETWVPADVTNTLNNFDLGDTRTTHAVVNSVAPTLTASNDPSRSPQSAEITQQVAAVHSVTMAVRRLTPIECERLQGFPDNWSRIPWKGKPETECPDGPRYKACGNSMAVPVMRWIGERIAAIEASSHA